MHVIESASNEKIKNAVHLCASSKARREKKEFFLEGLRLCRDAALSGVEVKSFFYTENALEKHRADVDFISERAQSSFLVSSSVSQKLADTQTPQGFFCVCSFLEEKTEEMLLKKGKFIALENVQDPANLGAVSRTAEALGLTALIVENGCDIYNVKAQRAAMGSLLRLPVLKTADLFSLLERCREKGFKVYSTTPDSSAKSITQADMSGNVIAVIGNEGNGVSEKTASVCEKITIPMNGRAESLNASAAAALTMWEIVRSGI